MAAAPSSYKATDAAQAASAPTEAATAAQPAAAAEDSSFLSSRPIAPVGT
jgi:hypothetical protein